MTREDRGATVVEYALIAALLVIGLIVATQKFEDQAEERYGERSGQGDPAEAFGNLGPSGGGGGSGGTGGSTPPGGTVTALVVEPMTATASASNNTWSMTVTVRVTGDGQPLGGVIFSPATWNPSGGTRNCTTTSSGICTYTLAGLARTGGAAVPTATFTLGTPSYTNPDGSSPTTSGPAATTKSCTKPSTGSGTFTCP